MINIFFLSKSWKRFCEVGTFIISSPERWGHLANTTQQMALRCDLRSIPLERPASYMVAWLHAEHWPHSSGAWLQPTRLPPQPLSSRTIGSGAPGTAGSWRSKRAEEPEAQWVGPWAWRLGGEDSANGGAGATGQPGRGSGRGGRGGLHPGPGAERRVSIQPGEFPAALSKTGAR